MKMFSVTDRSGKSVGLLVDHGDTGGLGLRGAGEVDRFAVEEELAGIAAVEAGDDLDERRLARAVLADEGVDRSAFQRQAARAQSDDGAEGLDHPVQVQGGMRRVGGDIVCHGRASSLR